MRVFNVHLDAQYGAHNTRIESLLEDLDGRERLAEIFLRNAARHDCANLSGRLDLLGESLDGLDDICFNKGLVSRLLFINEPLKVLVLQVGELLHRHDDVAFAELEGELEPLVLDA